MVLKPNSRGGDRTVDHMDRKILSALRADGRLTMNELAEKVGLSPSPCWTRVKRLEKIGAIQHYAAVLDHDVLGLSNTVFVEVMLDKHSDDALEAFGAALSRMPEVIEAHLVSGDYDYLVKVAVVDTADYERFLRQRLYKTEGVRHTKSIFALRAMKKGFSIDPLAVPGGE
jgi:Lrp/AsnC family leucine-responsive transcriptional regulator